MKKYLLMFCILFSNITLAETPYESLPGAPDNLKLEIITPYRGKLTWTDTATNEVRFMIGSGAQSKPLQTLQPNTQHAFVNVTPGQATTFIVCAETSRGVACSDPLEALIPQAKGSIRGRMLYSNFRPVANKTFQLNGMTDLRIEQQINFNYADPYVRRVRLQFEVPDHLLLDPNQSQMIVMQTYITSENPDCRINIEEVRQNGLKLYFEGSTLVRSLYDTSGLWSFTVTGTAKCTKANFEARFHSYMAPTVGQFTTDENGYFEITDIAIAGSYRVNEKENALKCVSSLDGREYIGITKNTRNANFICRKL